MTTMDTVEPAVLVSVSKKPKQKKDTTGKSNPPSLKLDFLTNLRNIANKKITSLENELENANNINTLFICKIENLEKYIKDTQFKNFQCFSI